MLTKFIHKEYFQDRWMSILAGSSLIFGILGVARVLLNVKLYEFKITVRYTQYGPDPFKLGDWYSLYDLAFFISITTIVALALSMRLFKLNRTLALTVLIFHHIIILFFFLVANAILGIPPVTS